MGGHASEEREARAAKAYGISARLNPELRRDHDREFVAIEIDSEAYIVGPTLEAALGGLKRRFPTSRTHTLRIGDNPATASFRGKH